MTIRNGVMAGLSALAIAAGAPALAAPSQEAIDAVVAHLVAQGYSGEIRIRPSGDRLVVEASGAAGQTERVYSGDGSRLFEEETRRANGGKVERDYDVAGNVVEEEYDDDDDEDDDDDDDRAERAKEEREDRREREDERAEDRREREEEKSEKRRERDEDDDEDDEDDDDDEDDNDDDDEDDDKDDDEDDDD